jgi:DNA-directed RNA polymerase specialized sigma subunit
MRFSPRQLIEALPERQKLACALRFGGPGPHLSYHLIAHCMGISRPTAWHLVRKGKARIRAQGYDIASLYAQAAA